jgi:hypothetical protein
VLFIAAAALFYTYPYFTAGQEKTTIQGTGLRNRLANDFLILKSLLLSPLDEKDTLKADSLIKDFFALQEKATLPYTGLVLLDGSKKVLSACQAEQDGKNPDMIGNSYAGIDFKGSEKSLHKVLTLYRSDSRRPMGQKGIEIAFELHSEAGLLGWILFQLDIEELERTYGLDEDDLINFEFQR